MSVAIDPAALEVLIPEATIQARIAEMADALAPRMTGDWTVVILLQGAIPFGADLLKALGVRGVHPVLDCLWLESYRDAMESSGRVMVRADISRSVEGRGVLIVDEVFDTGRTLAFARTHFEAKGAREVVTCALVRKPLAVGQPVDLIGFDCPDRFLIGYGMDVAGKWRELPFIGAVD
jgi:hypoxanthine phosphoribosyltransferase